MIMDGDRERLFCDVLADHILVEGTPDVSRLRNPDRRRLAARINWRYRLSALMSFCLTHRKLAWE